MKKIKILFPIIGLFGLNSFIIPTISNCGTANEFKINCPTNTLVCNSNVSTTALTEDGWYDNITYHFTFPELFVANQDINNDEFVITAKCNYDSVVNSSISMNVNGKPNFIDSKSFQLSFNIEYNSITSWDGDELFNMPANTHVYFTDIKIEDKTKSYSLDVNTNAEGILVENFLIPDSPSPWQIEKDGEQYKLTGNFIAMNLIPSRPILPEGLESCTFRIYFHFNEGCGWHDDASRSDDTWKPTWPHNSKNQINGKIMSYIKLDEQHDDTVDVGFTVNFHSELEECSYIAFQKLISKNVNYKAKVNV